VLQIFVEERKEEGMRKTGGWGGGVRGEKCKERRRESRKEEK